MARLQIGLPYMRVSFLALGSRGDVQPSLALAQTLAGRGHSVRFISHPGFAGLVGGRGVEFCPLSAMHGELAGSKGKELFAKGLQPLFAFRAAVALAKRYSLEWSREFCALAKGSDCVVGTTYAAYSAASIGKHWTIPHIQAFFQPILPSGAFSSVFLPDFPRPLPAFANRLTHRIFNQLVWTVLRPLASEAAKEVWNESRTPFLSPIRSTRDEGRPTLMSFSRHVVAPPEDWDSSIAVTGYWFLERPAEWQAPLDLVRFIEAGPPPIYIGFGSMTLKDPAATSALVLEAIEKVECRAVIGKGWGHLRPANPPPGVFLVDDVPHDWLFPRMASIVHHGGAGTVGSALRAGRPSVVVPFIADQPFWGRRLFELGVAPKALPYRAMDADSLAAAIELSLGDEPMRAKAAKLGALIEAEQGTSRAADLIEAAACGRGPTAVGDLGA